jgi:hypothetical protein
MNAARRARRERIAAKFAQRHALRIAQPRWLDPRT